MVSRTKRPTDTVPQVDPGNALRQKAEAQLRRQEGLRTERSAVLSEEQSRKDLHDLRVYQIELEMQNDELRRSQVALAAERERYFDLYDLAPVGYCTVGETGLVEQANLTAAMLLCLPRTALLKQSFSRFIVKSDQDAFYLCRQKMLRTGKPQARDLWMLKGDGHSFLAALSATLAHDDGGGPMLRITLTDVTESRQAQAALRESEEQYNNLFDLGPVAVYSCDASGRIQKFNRRAGELWGREPLLNDARDRYCGSFKMLQDDGSILPPDQCPMADVTCGRIDEVRDREGTIERPDGSRVTAVVNIRPSKNLRGEIIGAIGFFYDITERKRFEVDLDNAREAAEQANLAKSAFLSSMSHELRTPLSAVLGFAQLIESGTPAPTPAQKRSVDQILRAGWHLLTLIDEILDLSLIESGRTALVLEPIFLNDVSEECRAMVEPMAQARAVSVDFPEFEHAFQVIADRTRLKQILINLLSNAVKYNRRGGSVVLACHVVVPDRIRICVQDSGEGMPQDKVKQLFQPFNRLGQEAGPVQGTGIGLVVCKRLIELMGGFIGVESTVGKGTEFWIELEVPATRPRSARGDAATPAALSGDRAAEALRTVLCVEDNQANLLLMEELFARRPELRLITAGDGLRGVEMAISARPDVILMDINLPGISGISALKKLAGFPATAHIPVIALSANAMTHDIQHGLAAGFFRYLTKPIKVNEFMATLDAALAFAAAEPPHADHGELQ